MEFVKVYYRCEECQRAFSVTRRDDDVTEHETCTRCMKLADRDYDRRLIRVDAYGTATE